MIIEQFFVSSINPLLEGVYCKSPKFLDSQNIAVITLKFIKIGLTAEKANEIANSEDPDQTAPLGAV